MRASLKSPSLPHGVVARIGVARTRRSSFVALSCLARTVSDPSGVHVGRKRTSVELDDGPHFSRLARRTRLEP